MTTAIEGIIIRAFPYSESDLVLRVISRSSGKTSLLARSARSSQKRFPGGLDIFDHALFQTKSGKGSLPLLISSSALHSPRQLREDLDKFSIASFLCECFDLLVPEESAESEELFNLFSSSMLELSSASDLRSSLRIAFLCSAALLRISGYLDPDLEIKPGRNNMLKLIKLIERSAEKQLNTAHDMRRVVESVA